MLNHYKENKSRWKKTGKKEKHQSSPNRIPTNINIFNVKCKTVSTNTKNCNKTGKDTETQC